MTKHHRANRSHRQAPPKEQVRDALAFIYEGGDELRRARALELNHERFFSDPFVSAAIKEAQTGEFVVLSAYDDDCPEKSFVALVRAEQFELVPMLVSKVMASAGLPPELSDHAQHFRASLGLKPILLPPPALTVVRVLLLMSAEARARLEAAVPEMRGGK